MTTTRISAAEAVQRGAMEGSEAPVDLDKVRCDRLPMFTGSSPAATSPGSCSSISSTCATPSMRPTCRSGACTTRSATASWRRMDRSSSSSSATATISPGGIRESASGGRPGLRRTSVPATARMNTPASSPGRSRMWCVSTGPATGGSAYRSHGRRSLPRPGKRESRPS